MSLKQLKGSWILVKDITIHDRKFIIKKKENDEIYHVSEYKLTGIPMFELCQTLQSYDFISSAEYKLLYEKL